MTKVKIPGPNPRKPNKLSVVFGGSIATIFLLILVKYMISRKDEAPLKSSPKVSKERIDPVTGEPKVSTVESPFKGLKDMGLTEKQMAKVYIDLKYGNDPRRKKIAEQAKLLREFKKKIHLEMGFPVTMNYIEIDLDDRVAAIMGTSLDGKKNFTVLATDQKASLETALSYLKGNLQTFDFVGRHQFLPEKMISIKAPESTGLKDLKIVPSSDHKGQSLYVAFAPRKDGKGTYLFMMEAPRYEFIQNEDGLEKMLETVKVQE